MMRFRMSAIFILVTLLSYSVIGLSKDSKKMETDPAVSESVRMDKSWLKRQITLDEFKERHELMADQLERSRKKILKSFTRKKRKEIEGVLMNFEKEVLRYYEDFVAAYKEGDEIWYYKAPKEAHCETSYAVLRQDKVIIKLPPSTCK